MTYPASQYTVQDALREIAVNVVNLKTLANQAQTALAGAVDTRWAFELIDRIGSAISAIAAVRGTAGLDVYAKNQYAQIGLDLNGELQNVLDVANAALAAAMALFPMDPTGYILAHQFDPSGRRIARTFDTGETKSLVRALATLAASIS